MVAIVLSLPVWASEHTVTIHRNEGLYQDGTGVYYCVKDGIMMTFTDGLDNENYLVERHDKYFEVNSYNYLIKKIVFHCVDNTTASDLDCFYWGPTTISIVQNFYDRNNPGTYQANGYTGTWTGTSNHMQFTTMGKPVRFGSVDIVYDKLDGDIFDLVTNINQIQEGKTYIAVSQNHDQVMKVKMNDESTIKGTSIVEWMGPQGNEKSRVKVDGNALLFRLENVKDSLNGTRKGAILNTLNGYIRESTSGSGKNLMLSTSKSAYNSGVMYIGTAYNWLCWFRSGSSNGSNTIRYDNSANEFKIMSYSDADTRVWLYKLAEAYNITTECEPDYGGTINLGDGVVNATSQQGETVNFTVNPAEGYRVSSVTVTNRLTGESIPYGFDATTGNYSFVMPAANVIVKAVFDVAGQPYIITTECLPNDDAGYISVYEGVNIYDDAIHANEGSMVTFWVGTRNGWLIHEVKVTDPSTGEDVPFTLIDDQTSGGLRYQMAMPASNVKIQAIFYPYEKLYLLGTANGGDWAPNGPEFNYDPYKNVYYLKVYYKGIRGVAGRDDDTMGYFSLSTLIHDNDWDAIRPYRLVAHSSSQEQSSVPIGNGDTKPLYRVSDGANPNNAFTIPAGVYFLKVPVDKSAISVTEVPLSLDLNEMPQGVKINETDDVTYVAYGTRVTASSGLQAEVQSINSSEVGQTFMMSTDGGTNWSDGNAVAITAPGVTTVTGQAYIGYIIVENTGKYAYTPLSYIESNIDPGTPVVVCDTIVGTWAVDNAYGTQLWAKDLGEKSIDKTYIQEGENGQTDYVKDILHYQKNAWDQSNWVVVDFASVGSDPEELVGYAIEPLSVVGLYTDNTKHRITLTKAVNAEQVLAGVDYSLNYPGYMDDYYEAAEGYSYMYNHYVMANFMPENLNAPYGNGFVAGQDVLKPFRGAKLYFMNPKSQEIAHVMGVWNGANQFAVYQRDNENNAYDYSGVVNVSWIFNRVNPSEYGMPELEKDMAYVFHMAIELLPTSGMTLNGAKPGAASARYMGYPLDLPAHGAIPTSVKQVNSDKSVQSVSFYNVMGIESRTPHQGINIVVTRYSDGTHSVAKLIR